MNQIILISGLYGSGKSELASILHSKLNGNFVNCERFSFAGKVKEIAYNQFNWDGKKDSKGRKLLQNIGNMGREYNSDMWVNYLSEKVGSYRNTLFIVDDWRYPNEYFNIKNINVERDVFTTRIFRNTKRDKKVLQDPSESSLPEEPNFYDYYMYNNFKDLETLNNSSYMDEYLNKIINNFLKL